MKKAIIIICLLVSFAGYAQEGKYQITDEDYDNNRVEMADAMRQSGKIYVVVGVILIVFGGILFYLIRTEKKLSKLEEELGSSQPNSDSE